MNLTKTHPVWRSLIEGTKTHKFKAISASMMLSRLSREYKYQPSHEKMQASIDEAMAFFQKYERIFHDDLVQIFE